MSSDNKFYHDRAPGRDGERRIESDIERWARLESDKQEPRAPAHATRPARPSRSTQTRIPPAFVGLCVVLILALVVTVAFASGIISLTIG